MFKIILVVLCLSLTSRTLAQTFCSNGLNYQLSSSDTASTIVTAYSSAGVTLASLISANPSVNFNLPNLSNYYPYVCVPVNNLATSTSSPIFTTTVTSFPTTCNGVYYAIVNGDTAATILTKYSYTGLTYAQLVAANPTVNFNVGNLASYYTVLCLPLSSFTSTSSPTVSTCPGFYYQVKSTDTTYTILSTYSYAGLTLPLLQTYNPTVNFNLGTTLLASYPNLVLCIPVSSSLTTTPSSFPNTNCLNTALSFSGDTCAAIITRLGTTLANLIYCNGSNFCNQLSNNLLFRY